MEMGEMEKEEKIRKAKRVATPAALNPEPGE
jgi:hypothetical protein